MAKTQYHYKLRLHRSPERIRMDRLAEYMRAFADLLGIDNTPVFKGMRNESTGLLAAIDPARQRRTMERLHAAKTDPQSRPASSIRNIEAMLGADAIKKAEVVTETGKVVYLFQPEVPADDEAIRVYQAGTVDGTVTGIVGADDTMHLYLRDRRGKDLKIIVRDEGLARSLLKQFRDGLVRLYVRGPWLRSDKGWVPEASRCVLERYEVLAETPLTELFAAMRKAEGNGWAMEKNPLEKWRSIREGD